ncbi:rCG37142, isoform CRA_a [Rattus norvegicus]|uniref:RCG37142, isoform CRA_a n=1 Tax=Rattus norvegicus TaxID=10116 RepID=A6HTV8_RAT|nr:rCG37142, isoform CRA_a [Rattus norvegicus]
MAASGTLAEPSACSWDLISDQQYHPVL